MRPSTIGRYYFVLFVQHPVTVGRKFVTSTLDDLLFEILTRCRGEHDDFLIRSQERLGDSDGRTSYPYPNRDTTTDRDTVTEDQVQGNETLMR
jgi:hypothetical protein